jgi:hypothetical protein
MIGKLKDLLVSLLFLNVLILCLRLLGVLAVRSPETHEGS